MRHIFSFILFDVVVVVDDDVVVVVVISVDAVVRAPIIVFKW